MKAALLDGDIIAHTAAAVWQGNADWGFGYKRQIEPIDIVNEAHRIVRDWTLRAGCDTSIVCLSPPTNFRHYLTPTYKAQRPPKDIASEEEGIDRLAVAFATLRADFDTRLWAHLEADDVMGILGSADPDGTVVVTIDKDLLTVPCTFFNPRKDAPPARVSRFEADFHWFYQTLRGDPVDGYSGCPGMGEKRSTALLRSHSSDMWWGAVVAAYAEKGLTLDDAVLQARLARILRHTDHDQASSSITLWHPTTPETYCLLQAEVVRPPPTERALRAKLWKPEPAPEEPVRARIKF